MSRSQSRLARTFVASLLAISIAVLGCSTDSPTAPVQQPGPATGTQPSAAWNITVKSSPRQLTVGSTDPATVSVTVRRADNNQPPPQGTTMVLSTSLGEFDAAGSGLTSIAIATVNGRADAFLFAGTILGTALVTAQLEASAGQVGLPIVAEIEPVVASFAFANSNENLSLLFQDTSTGGPTKWRWDFGDGSTSKEQNPAHLYAAEGDYVVTLTASKKDSEDTASQIISVTEDPDDVVEASFDFVVNQLTVVFLDTSSGNPTRFQWDFGDGATSSQQNPTHRYASEGTYVVSLTASNSRTQSTASQTVTTTEDLFIEAISPNGGPDSGGTAVTISGIGFNSPLQVFFGELLATVTGVSATSISAVTPPGVVDTEDCDVGGTDGVRNVATPVEVRVVLSSGSSASVSGGFTYQPVDTSCRI